MIQIMGKAMDYTMVRAQEKGFVNRNFFFLGIRFHFRSGT